MLSNHAIYKFRFQVLICSNFIAVDSFSIITKRSLNLTLFVFSLGRETVTLLDLERVQEK